MTLISDIKICAMFLAYAGVCLFVKSNTKAIFGPIVNPKHKTTSNRAKMTKIRRYCRFFCFDLMIWIGKGDDLSSSVLLSNKVVVDDVDDDDWCCGGGDGGDDEVNKVFVVSFLFGGVTSTNSMLFERVFGSFCSIVFIGWDWLFESLERSAEVEGLVKVESLGDVSGDTVVSTGCCDDDDNDDDDNDGDGGGGGGSWDGGVNELRLIFGVSGVSVLKVALEVSVLCSDNVDEVGTSCVEVEVELELVEVKLSWILLFEFFCLWRIDFDANIVPIHIVKPIQKLEKKSIFDL